MTEATGPLSSHASVGQPGMFFFSCSRSIITEVPFHICTCVRSTNLPLAKASHVAKPWEMQTHLAKWHWYRAGDELVPLMQLIYPDFSQSLSHPEEKKAQNLSWTLLQGKGNHFPWSSWRSRGMWWEHHRTGSRGLDQSSDSFIALWFWSIHFSSVNFIC